MCFGTTKGLVMKPTETTMTLLRALQQVNALNLDRLFASGIDVTLDSYTDDCPAHLDRVTLHGEDFAPVRDALREALRKAVDRRRASLARDLVAVENALK